MAKVLFIDDVNAVCENVKERLEPYHEVITIQKRRWDDACDEAGKILGISEDNAFDALVLDLHYDSQHEDARQGDFGGIWIYNELVRLGLRARWTDTIIYSRLVPPNWNAASTGKELAIRVFLNTADIPYDCAVLNTLMGVDNLIDKIAELVAP